MRPRSEGQKQQSFEEKKIPDQGRGKAGQFREAGQRLCSFRIKFTSENVKLSLVFHRKTSQCSGSNGADNEGSRVRRNSHFRTIYIAQEFPSNLETYSQSISLKLELLAIRSLPQNETNAFKRIKVSVVHASSSIRPEWASHSEIESA